MTEVWLLVKTENSIRVAAPNESADRFDGYLELQQCTVENRLEGMLSGVLKLDTAAASRLYV